MLSLSLLCFTFCIIQLALVCSAQYELGLLFFILFRSALMCCLKMLKLFLVCQAYAFIITVSQEIKANSGAINGERHQSACHVQDAINTIIPSVEQQLKARATVIAKAVTEKV